jgi:hypothetical protein
MDDLLPFPRHPSRAPQAGDDQPVADEAWQHAVLDGDAAPAVAGQYHIDDLQHWIDLSA